MDISYLLTLERTRKGTLLSSKKRTLEFIGNLTWESLKKSCEHLDIEEDNIVNALFCREKLSSTGIGNGVAIPHGRLENIKQICAVLLVLDKPIDFDSLDHKPVDIILALLVPNSNNNEHIKVLSRFAELLHKPEVLARWREAPNTQSLYDDAQNSITSIFEEYNSK